MAKAGTNPLDDPDCGEFAIASCLGAKFEELGCEVILEDCTSGWDGAVEGFAPRTNIYVVLESKKNPDAKWLAIDTHIDTVRLPACPPPACHRRCASFRLHVHVLPRGCHQVMVTGMQPYGAFDADVTPDGKIHGRGSCDTKATFAIVLTILQEMQAANGSLEDFPVRANASETSNALPYSNTDFAKTRS